MLCEVCWLMLRGQVGRRWVGAFDLMFDHHGSIETLQASHHMGCGICRVLYEAFVASAKNGLETGNEDDAEQPSDWGNGKVETDLSARSTALLGVIHDTEEVGVFRLDFKLVWGPRELLWVSEEQPMNIVRRTFVLKQTGMKFLIRNSELTILIFLQIAQELHPASLSPEKPLQLRLSRSLQAGSHNVITNAIHPVQIQTLRGIQLV